MSFTCGNAYRLKCYFTQPNPKEKYALCVCEEKPLFFLINSLPRRRHTANSQLKITPGELPFLAHDSYINTAEVITCVVSASCDILKDYGPISRVLKQRIKSTVLDSVTLPTRFINTISAKL